MATSKKSFLERFREHSENPQLPTGLKILAFFWMGYGFYIATGTLYYFVSTFVIKFGLSALAQNDRPMSAPFEASQYLSGAANLVFSAVGIWMGWSLLKLELWARKAAIKFLMVFAAYYLSVLALNAFYTPVPTATTAPSHARGETFLEIYFTFDRIITAAGLVAAAAFQWWFLNSAKVILAFRNKSSRAGIPPTAAS